MAQRTKSLIPTATWTVDAAHSSIGFAVKHMGIANVRGRFTEFEGTSRWARISRAPPPGEW